MANAQANPEPGPSSPSAATFESFVAEFRLFAADTKKTQADTKKTLDKLSSDMDKVSSDVDDLKSKFSKYEPLFEKAGDTFEIVARREVRDAYGSAYARSFDITDLHGLARVSLPKDFEFGRTDPLTGSLVSVAAQRRVELLAKVALKQLPILRGFAESHEIIKDKLHADYNKKLKLLKDQLKNITSSDSERDQLEYLASSRLGLWCFSSIAYDQVVDDVRFTRELEMDLRGDVTVFGTTIIISAGEVKSGKDQKTDGLHQLCKRLTVLAHACQTLFMPVAETATSASASSNISNYRILLQGKLFTSRRSKWSRSFSSDNIQEAISHLHLRLPPGTQIDINIDVIT